MILIASSGLACDLTAQVIQTPPPTDLSAPAIEATSATGSASESAPPDVQNGETTILVTDLGPTETYVDENLGYAFDYPAEWDILALPDIPGASVTISSWQQEEAGSGGIPAGGQKLDITPLLQVSYMEAQELVRQQNQGIDLVETELDLPYGPQAVLFVYPVEEGLPEIRQMVTSVNGTTLMFSGLGETLTFFEAIAYTVRAVE
ncbi:MAG: hypothetical protein DWQ07_22300 [Chloroflexi bacterium]|nr:MAG: hypothetical protein DWQ07_22300 [Chloroflexota bacterium]MBL1193880.1 hypothetical protein [Chloroflexota bacterium]